MRKILDKISRKGKAEVFVVGPEDFDNVFSIQSGMRYFSLFGFFKAVLTAAWYIALGVGVGYIFTKTITQIWLRLVAGFVISLVYINILDNFYLSSGSFISFNACATTSTYLLVVVGVIATGIYILREIISNTESKKAKKNQTEKGKTPKAQQTTS